MQINIKTSEKNKILVQELTRKLNLGTENHIARIAFSYSLSHKKEFNLDDIQDSKGKEYKEDILFGRYKDFYIALICQFYNLHKTHNDIPKYIKLHIDHGLEIINDFLEKNKNYSSTDFLLEIIEKGISELDDLTNHYLDPVIYSSKIQNKSFFSNPLNIEIGYLNNETVFFKINDLNFHNNSHIAIVGNSGTGKTYFALNFLKKIFEKTNGIVNFIYLDFKGITDDDFKTKSDFFQKTNTEVIRLPQDSFPINPLSIIDISNEKNKTFGINKIVDILSNYNNLGVNQTQILKDSLKDVFSSHKLNEEYPTFKYIYELVREKENNKHSKLTDILQKIGDDFDLFKNQIKITDFINQNYYISLGSSLPDNIRFTALFLIINLIYNAFMNMDDTPVQNNSKGLRYLLVIDEAHVIFKDKKNHDILEKILREIRSKGVAVMLITQGIEEFNQPNFDFSSMCDNVFMFDIKDKSNLKMILKFLGLGNNYTNTVRKSLENVAKYQLLSNLKEFKVGELFNSLKE